MAAAVMRQVGTKPAAPGEKGWLLRPMQVQGRVGLRHEVGPCAILDVYLVQVTWRAQAVAILS